eukprot:UN14560
MHSGQHALRAAWALGWHVRAQGVCCIDR